MSLVCQRSLPTHAPPWVHCSCNLRKADCGGGPRGSASSFTIGSKGYVGIGGNNGIEKKDFWEFDPVGNTWTQKADFGGTAREQATQFAIGIKDILARVTMVVPGQVISGNMILPRIPGRRKLSLGGQRDMMESDFPSAAKDI